MEIPSANSHAWPWPDSLDALAAAPDYHRLLLENDHVRVLEVCIKPGQIVPVHTHRWPSVVHVKSASDFLRRDAEGKLVFDSRSAGAPQKAPDVAWTPPLPPHSVENIGASEIHLVSVELKHVAA
jgi:predicted metal-dependent enzyme (double-stranded beta helix superfamily)